MLMMMDRMLGKAVLSIHVAGQIGRVIAVMIDPREMKVAALRVFGPELEPGSMLMARDIREVMPIGIAIDTVDDLVVRGEVIKLDEILETGFELKKLKVVTESGVKLGRVKNALIDWNDFTIQRVVVTRPFFQGLFDPEFLIGRSQIVEMTNEAMVVEDAAEINTLKESLPKDFVNPFRTMRTEPDPGQTPDEVDTEPVA